MPKIADSKKERKIVQGRPVNNSTFELAEGGRVKSRRLESKIAQHILDITAGKAGQEKRRYICLLHRILRLHLLYFCHPQRREIRTGHTCSPKMACARTGVLILLAVSTASAASQRSAGLDDYGPIRPDTANEGRENTVNMY